MKLWKIKIYPGTILVLGVAILIYELATDVYKWLNPLLFPGIARIIPAFRESYPELVEGLLNSLGLLLPSYLLALILGVIAGLFVGWYILLRKTLLPIFRGLGSIPPTLYIPYAISVLPTFWTASAFIIFISCLWPIVMGTIHGVTLLEDRYLDNAYALQIKGWKLLRRIIFPASLPMIFSGAGMGLTFGFILLTVAEMFGAKSGLGFFIVKYAEFFNYRRVLIGLMVMCVLIITIMAGFDQLQKHFLKWNSKR